MGTNNFCYENRYVILSDEDYAFGNMPSIKDIYIGVEELLAENDGWDSKTEEQQREEIEEYYINSLPDACDEYERWRENQMKVENDK